MDVIEAGFPTASPGDFEAVRADRAARCDGPIIAGLARCNRERHRPRLGGRAGRRQRRASTSSWPPRAIHREYKLKHGQGGDRPAGRGGRAATPAACAPTSSSRPRTPRAPSSDFLRRGRRGGHRGRRDDRQHARHGRLRRARTSSRELIRVPRRARARASTRPSSQRPLPQRPGPGGGQHAGRPCRPAPARSSARSTASASAPATASLEEVVMALQTRADASRPAHRHRRPSVSTRPAAWSRSVTGMLVQRNKAIVGAERLRPRGRHPPARHAEEPLDLRDHAARGRRLHARPSSCSASTPAATRCAPT
ncbi:MAG: hypothetical protein MZV70_10610 [Desulfobacterales bacterium]|nr:hypothetical protein [Desulfobacterales bacterium]